MWSLGLLYLTPDDPLGRMPLLPIFSTWPISTPPSDPTWASPVGVCPLWVYPPPSLELVTLPPEELVVCTPIMVCVGRHTCQSHLGNSFKARTRFPLIFPQCRIICGAASLLEHLLGILSLEDNRQHVFSSQTRTEVWGQWAKSALDVITFPWCLTCPHTGCCIRSNNFCCCQLGHFRCYSQCAVAPDILC